MSEKLPQPAICIHTCAHQGRLPLSVTLPLPSVTLIFWNLTSGQKWRTEGAVTASLSSVSHHLSYTTKKEKPLCQAGRHDLWLPCFYLCKTVLVFFFFSHESTATGFIDCSSVGPLGSSLLHIAEVLLCLPLGFLSSALLEGSAWGGKGKGWWEGKVGGGVHIQGCTLMITVVFPQKVFF